MQVQDRDVIVEGTDAVGPYLGLPLRFRDGIPLGRGKLIWHYAGIYEDRKPWPFRRRLAIYRPGKESPTVSASDAAVRHLGAQALAILRGQIAANPSLLADARPFSVTIQVDGQLVHRWAHDLAVAEAFGSGVGRMFTPFTRTEVPR